MDLGAEFNCTVFAVRVSVGGTSAGIRFSRSVLHAAIPTVLVMLQYHTDSINSLSRPLHSSAFHPTGFDILQWVVVY